MALECDPPHSGDIGDHEEQAEPDPDRFYEREIEQRIEAAMEGSDE